MRFNFSDEEIALTYARILEENEQEKKLELSDEIALITAMIAKYTQHTELLDCGYLLDLIKLKAILIKEERVNRERLYKEEIALKRVESVPLEDFKNAVSEVVTVLQKYLDSDSFLKCITELGTISHRLENKNVS